MNKIKLLFFLPHLVGGGAEKVTINIINSLDTTKYALTLVVLSKNGPLFSLIREDIEIIEIGANKTIFSIFKLRKIINKIEPDIIFSSILRSHIALYVALLCYRKHIKLVFRSPNSPKLLNEKNQLNFIIEFFLRKAYQKADRVIAQTPEMKQEIESCYHVDKSKIMIFINPIDTKLIANRIRNIVNPFEKNYINIVAAGRLAPQKGYDTLLKSFKIVKNKNPKFKLHIIGEDVIGEKKRYIELIQSLGVENSVVFHGFQSNPYKFFYFADLYVLSSRWEGLPNTVLENIFLEKPIVATRCIPFMDVLIKDGKNGFLVDVDDVEAMASAIMNYRKLDTSYKTINFNNLSSNTIFERLF